MNPGYVQNYKDVKAREPAGLRGMARHVGLTSLSILRNGIGVDGLLMRPRVQMLFIHHIFRDEEQKFDRLLTRLAKHHRFISYSEAVDRILSDRIDAPCIAFSSDDGFRNNLAAGHILKDHGATACFFINPQLIGERDPGNITTHCRERLNFPPVEFLDWDDVAALRSNGHEIGSHTMAHINIAATATELVEKDMQESREVLLSRCGIADHFAYPYGRVENFNAAAREACASAGFRSCASAERGCHVKKGGKPDQDKLILQRDHIVLDWPLDHIMYFVARNAYRAKPFAATSDQ